MLLAALVCCADGLLVGSPARARASMMATDALASPAASSSAAVAAERYVATNRFRVKPGREAAFEKRWADRQSSLGLLDGFRFFCMMRRTDGEQQPEDDINYISCTVWDDKPSFDAWKTGSAFKEAHGGGTIGGIASMLVATAMNTKGKPKAAMWEGLLPVSMAPDAPAEGGWRQVEADGETTLDGEAFIAMNRFSVSPGSEAAFEQRFASRESTLSTFDGFKGFTLLRRDGPDPDGFTHSTWSVWRDRAAFEVWRDSEQRAGKPKGAGGPPAAAAGGKPPAGGGPPGGGMFVRPPVPTFYEGILVLESGKGV
jgi:heme-degrading monooxygenase HmoA